MHYVSEANKIAHFWGGGENPTNNILKNDDQFVRFKKSRNCLINRNFNLQNKD
jgi:hypothetical protein